MNPEAVNESKSVKFARASTLKLELSRPNRVLFNPTTFDTHHSTILTLNSFPIFTWFSFSTEPSLRLLLKKRTRYLNPCGRHIGNFCNVSLTEGLKSKTCISQTAFSKYSENKNAGPARRLAKNGFAVYGLDYEGHGKSDGLQGLVMNFDDVIEDCSNHFSKICEKPENKEKKRYLLGESMGGAVALLLHRKNPSLWDGAILSAPMCKIADELQPNAVVANVLNALNKVIPKWKIIPTEDIVDKAFKEPEVREQIRANKYCYKGKPRLRTGYELNRLSAETEQILNEVSLPFLILHGEEDKLIDISVSTQLFELASSSDKTMKLYPGMWHGLLYGEPPENLDIVYSDIIGWIEPRLERELKEENEDSVKD